MNPRRDVLNDLSNPAAPALVLAPSPPPPGRRRRAYTDAEAPSGAAALERGTAMRGWAAGFLVVALTVPVSAEEQLYPAIEPRETGFLEVSGRHTLYWEVCGNDDGVPVIALHGGPGGSSGRGNRRLFDPARYRIIQFDQRGCGKSTPFADWRENSTDLLVEDIDRLCDHLGIEERVVLFGISWGTTLALAYAETNPDRVAGLILWGVFTCRQREIDHLYHGGAGLFYPDNYDLLRRVIPEPDKGGYPEQLFDVLTGTDEAAADSVVTVFSTYEAWMENVGTTRKAAREDALEPKARSLAVLENLYMMNRCFLEEGELMANADRLSEIPVYMVAGRLDMLTPPKTAYELQLRLPLSRLEIVEGSGHVDLKGALATIRGSNWILERLDR